jgi:CarD family transcriptional regulator
MIMRTGSKVIYPYQGLCTIGPVVKKIMNGKTMSFYHLAVQDDGGDLFVPIDKIESVGIRPLLLESEIPNLLDRLQEPTQAANHYAQRAHDNAKLIASGAALDLAEVVASLTELRQARALSFGEKKALDKAKRLLICEISEVMRQTEQEAEAQIDQALQARK